MQSWSQYFTETAIFSCVMLQGASGTTLDRVFPVQCCPRSIKTTLHRIFSCVILSGAHHPRQHCNVVPGVLRKHCSEFFPVQCRQEPLGQHCIGFFLCNAVPGVLQQHCTGFFYFFPMQCCLEPLGQHCIEFWPVQCCPKSITTTLNRIFFLCIVVWSLKDDIFNVGLFHICSAISYKDRKITEILSSSMKKREIIEKYFII